VKAVPVPDVGAGLVWIVDTEVLAGRVSNCHAASVVLIRTRSSIRSSAHEADFARSMFVERRVLRIVRIERIVFSLSSQFLIESPTLIAARAAII
jgi:hypothetical protein